MRKSSRSFPPSLSGVQPVGRDILSDAGHERLDAHFYRSYAEMGKQKKSDLLHPNEPETQRIDDLCRFLISGLTRSSNRASGKTQPHAGDSHTWA